MESTNKVLFVDDEVRILKGLRRNLFRQSDNWKLSFASSGKEAVQMLRDEPFHVIVSDLRMPEMDGVALLEYVKEHYPTMIRIILSGYSSEEATLRTVNTAHQFIAKPCTEEDLFQAVSRATQVRLLLKNRDLKILIAKLDHVPVIPSVYRELVAELKQESVSMKKVGAIIMKDVGMTAKILQLVNSAFFGLSKKVSDPVLAVNLLGYNTIISLVLTIQVFDTFSKKDTKGFSIERIFDHSMKTARYAAKIARFEDQPKYVQDDCHVSGMLHDIGRLLLIGNVAEEYARMRKIRQQHKLDTLFAEQQAFGATHAELGGYLLGTWGLPDRVIEGVAYHHSPDKCPLSDISIPDIVCVANQLDHCLQGGNPDDVCNRLPKEHYESKGLWKRIPEWTRVCANLAL